MRSDVVAIVFLRKAACPYWLAPVAENAATYLALIWPYFTGMHAIRQGGKHRKYDNDRVAHMSSHYSIARAYSRV